MIHAYKNNFGINQYGFMPQKCCEKAINKAILLTEKHIGRKKCVLWICVDFKAAFDTAWWTAILNGLIKKFKIPINLFALVSSFLNNRHAIIKQRDHIVGHRKLERSCPQGSIISPLLWNILMDDILSRDLGCEKIAYADDCLFVILADNMIQLQNNSNQVLEKFSNLCQSIKLQINSEKTFFMIIKKNKIPKDFDIEINNVSLQRKDCAKYLDVTIGSNLKFNEHIKRITTAALLKMISFYRLGNTIWGYFSKMLQVMYQGVVESALTYASSVWFKAVKVRTNCEKLHRTQKLFSTKILKVWKTFSFEEAAFLSGIVPLEYTVVTKASEYWCQRDLLKLKECAAILGVNFDLPLIEQTAPPQKIYMYENLINNIAINIGDGKPGQDGCRIYTDGSKSENGVGCAYAVYKDQEIIESKKFALSPDCGAFQAEIFAIFKASEYIISVGEYLQVPNLRIVSDNQSGIKAIANPKTKNLLILNSRANLLASPIPIKLEWVRAHQADTFNNEVNLLAKQASSIVNTSHERCPKSVAISKIKNIITNQYFTN